MPIWPEPHDELSRSYFDSAVTLLRSARTEGVEGRTTAIHETTCSGAVQRRLL